MTAVDQQPLSEDVPLPSNKRNDILDAIHYAATSLRAKEAGRARSLAAAKRELEDLFFVTASPFAEAVALFALEQISSIAELRDLVRDAWRVRRSKEELICSAAWPGAEEALRDMTRKNVGAGLRLRKMDEGWAVLKRDAEPLHRLSIL